MLCFLSFYIFIVSLCLLRILQMGGAGNAALCLRFDHKPPQRKMRSTRTSLLRTSARPLCGSTSIPSVAARRLYAASTKPHVLINKDTKVICQGFTGKQVSPAVSSCIIIFQFLTIAEFEQGTFHSKQAIEYGTKMVGGVSPGKGGSKHLDLPVFNSVKEVQFL
jgi:hypothetical protein